MDAPISRAPAAAGDVCSGRKPTADGRTPSERSTILTHRRQSRKRTPELDQTIAADGLEDQRRPMRRNEICASLRQCKLSLRRLLNHAPMEIYVMSDSERC